MKKIKFETLLFLKIKAKIIRNHAIQKQVLESRYIQRIQEMNH